MLGKKEEFQNQILETETVNGDQILVEKKVGMISFPQFSSTDLAMSSKGKARKCEELYLSRQVIDTQILENDEIFVEENGDYGIQALEMVNGKINGTKLCDDLFSHLSFELKHGRDFMLQVLNSESLMASNAIVVTGERLIQIFTKGARSAKKSWSVMVSGFKGGTNIGKHKFPSKVVSSKILEAAVWDMSMISPRFSTNSSHNKMATSSINGILN